MKVKILVIDDDLSMCRYLNSLLSEEDYLVHWALNWQEAFSQIKAFSPHLIILDILIPGVNGLEMLMKIKEMKENLPVMVLSGCGQTNAIVLSMKLGAVDYISKPFDPDELKVNIKKILEKHKLTEQVQLLKKKLKTRENFQMHFGNNEKMRAIKEMIEQVADTDITVLIRGESGTGKELVARALYTFSSRTENPFIKVNCAALPKELLESELFGYEKGAFTGAHQSKPGKFEFANQGSIFLDEISEMHPSLQAKILQVLQDGQFSRLGGQNDVRVDVRILASTNKNLEEEVKAKRFREDLFYRLNVINIQLPPLRERKEEIPLLVKHFIEKYSSHYNKKSRALYKRTMNIFMKYDWPGNVRELENIIKRIIILGNEDTIQQELSIKRGGSFDSNGDPYLQNNGEMAYSLKDIGRHAAKKAEREAIRSILEKTHWNRKATADILQISYKALLYKIKETGLDKIQ